MIIIENTIISDDILTEHFCCDLLHCKGRCCIDGDAGAPLDDEEIEIMKENFHLFKPYMTTEGIATIEAKGFFETDTFGEKATPLNPDLSCAFANTDTKGTLYCAMEKAYQENDNLFIKPISCHLYPIRVSKLHNHWALNYHQWHICIGGVKKGKEEGLALYEFLKTPLIRKFGQEWYDILCASKNSL